MAELRVTHSHPRQMTRFTIEGHTIEIHDSTVRSPFPEILAVGELIRDFEADGYALSPDEIEAVTAAVRKMRKR